MRLILLAIFILGLTSCEDAINIPAPQTMEPVLKSQCLQKPNVGRCKAAFERYYFNQTTNECKGFIWGGCGGVVPFENLDKCQKSCE